MICYDLLWFAMIKFAGPMAQGVLRGREGDEFDEQIVIFCKKRVFWRNFRQSRTQVSFVLKKWKYHHCEALVEILLVVLTREILTKNVFLIKNKLIFCPAERDHHSQADSFYITPLLPAILVPFWYHFGTILVPFWYHVGTILVPSWYRLTPENELRFVYIWWEFVRMMFEAWGTFW